MSLIPYRGYTTTSPLEGIVRRGYSPYTGISEPPQTGYQYQTCLSLYGGSGYWLGAGASPAVAVGDIFIAQLITSPSGYAVQINTDGTVQVLSGGDMSRQSFLYNRYIKSSNTVDGPATIWVNEVAPFWASPINVNNSVVGTLIAPINLASVGYCTSSSGDNLVFSVISGSLPPGLILSSSGLIYGTPTTQGTYIFTIGATDYAGITTPSPLSQMFVSASGISAPPAIVTWINNLSATVSWFTGSYLLYNGVAPGTFGKYVGLTVTSTGSIYQLNALDMDYKLRARWS